MKLKNLYYILVIVLLVFESCSKDLGNYNYQDINAITIGGLLENSHPTGRIYEIPFKDTVRLNPVISGSLSGADTNALTFEWKVDSITVSKTKNLFYVANKRYGRIPAAFSVTDKSTGTVTSYHCFLNVVNPYKWGYYVLTQNKAKDASVYCLSTIAKKQSWEEVLFPQTQTLGRNPISISGTKKYGASASDFYNVITIGVQEAANPVTVIDSREFTPILYYNSSSYVGGGNFTFRPSQVISDHYFEIIYVINNGKFHVLRQGKIALAAFAKDPLDYQVALNGIATPYGNGRLFMSVYDEKNKKVRVWDNGMTGNEFLYVNDYKDIPGQEMMDGKTFLACSYANIPSINQIYLFRKDNQLYSYRLNYGEDYKPVSFDLLGEGPMPTSDPISYVYFDGQTSRWYMAAGKTIYMASYLGVEFQKYVQLPSDAPGNIVKFKILDGKLMVATNDPTANKPGSIYIYNANTMVLEQAHKHVVDEVVDLHLGIPEE
ncbi:PKD-like family lipoprotein [Sphingobacterium detergens]|uniref:PKD family protein n=1 Tax=Sphingobacterium detergens TaxID=1145106 RepID=A0A420ADD1_SPHD1|nr:PKD-like family lipoprotein [Sphingobacterium detergens]RKE42510.1 PKD family protein [Sphingobacterium detergens]